jgi:rhamnosyltransferase
MTDEVLYYANNVPGEADLVVTTNTTEKKAEIEERIRGCASGKSWGHWEVRVVHSNKGRDISAFLIDCADVLEDCRYDIVVKLHSKLSAQDPESVSSWFREHLFRNLLDTPSYARQVYRLFEDEPQLGMVFPPVIHMGLPTMGNGWTLNRQPAEKLKSRLGIDIPFDDFTPLSPYGSMFIARRKLLQPLLDAQFGVDEFPDTGQYHDGSLAHVLERLFSYVVFSQGYYARCIQSNGMASISANVLEHKFDRVSHYLYPFAVRQIEMLSGEHGKAPDVRIRSLIQRRLIDRFPRIGNALTDLWLRGKRCVSRSKNR